MATEIERKFLVIGDAWRIGNPTLFVQGYLNREAHATVRVRVAGDQAMLTVKGKVQGLSRAEYEYPIPMADARAMLKLCEGPLIEKKRWLWSAGDLIWEIDEFLGENAGLVVAEVELESEDQPIELPDWIGIEVSHDERYFNSNLSRVPFLDWAAE